MAARAACSELVILYVFEKLGEFAADKRKEILSMCVGLSAKVVKINDGVAIIDAGGAKREISSQLIEEFGAWEIMSWFMPVWPLPRLRMRMTVKQIRCWRIYSDE